MAKETAQQFLSDSYDLIVIGSGAGGMATAVTAAHHGLSVLVLEKEGVFGGTSAWSGGWLWIPENPLAKRAGITEAPGAPRQYVQSEMAGIEPDARVDAFLQYGPEMVAFFEQHSDLRFIDGNLIPDFHESEGHALGGRSVAAAPFDGRKLGERIRELRPPLSVISLFGMGIASGQDIRHFFNATRSLKSMLYVTRRVGRHLLDLLRYRRGMQLVNGNALIAALMATALRRGVHMRSASPVTGLLKESGRVTGVEARIDGKPVQIQARRGVVLAAGGFPHDSERQKKLLPEKAGIQHYSAAPRANTGDGLRLAETVGGRVTDDLSDSYAWSPISRVPNDRGEMIHFPHLVERAKPGIIAVLPNGRRFTSEADSYHDFMRALYAATPKGQEPHCWLLADRKAQRRWGLGWAKPFPFPLSGYIRSGYLKRGATVAELAGEISVPADALEQTITRFNTDARVGSDSEFHRGESPYNRIQGDPEAAGNPSLAPLAQAPFYAVKIEAGSLGTFAGIETDEQARVLDSAGKVIQGLSAVGNDMSSIFRGNYPSGGITLGPAMTFGYIIANRLNNE